MDVELDFGPTDQLGDLKSPGGTSSMFVIPKGVPPRAIALKIMSGPYNGKFVQQVNEKGLMIADEPVADWFELTKNRLKLRTDLNAFSNNLLGFSEKTSALGFWPDAKLLNIFFCVYSGKPQQRDIPNAPSSGYLEDVRLYGKSHSSSSSSSSTFS